MMSNVMKCKQLSICRLTLMSANFQSLRFDLSDENSFPNPRVMAMLQSAENHHIIQSLFIEELLHYV